MAETYCVDTTDCFGTRIVFSDEQRERKAQNRPELRDPGILGRIKQTVCHPKFVYEDLEHSGRKAYYTLEYSINGRNRYMKVIGKEKADHIFIVTAYRPDYVKERGKTKLMYGTDN